MLPDKMVVLRGGVTDRWATWTGHVEGFWCGRFGRFGGDFK